MKKIFWGFLFLLLIIPFISANVLLPFNLMTLPLMPFIFAIECVGFLLTWEKLFKIKIGFWKASLIIVVANLSSSLVGTIFGVLPTYTGMFIAFIISVVIEFGICLLFLIKKKIRILNLFWISLIINTMSYLFLLLFIRLTY